MAIHILAECPELIMSVRVGVIEPLKPLIAQGDCEVRFVRTVEIRKTDIAWADILVTVRGCDDLTRGIVSEAKKAGRFIIYYLDDDLLNIPRESGTWRLYHDPRVRENIHEILSQTDVLWGVNRRIRDQYLPLTNGRWMENHVPATVEENGSAESGANEPVKILYAGSVDHTPLIQEFLSPVVRRIAEEYGERVSFTFIGADPGLNDLKNVRYLPFIHPYEAYRQFMRENRFSIGLAPGRDSGFYACKYYNKFVEYAAIGAAGVYTAADPYLQIVRNGENGLLCENTQAAWHDGIVRLINDPALRTRCAAEAVSQIREEFNPASVAEEILRQCPELTGYHAPEVEAKSIRLPNRTIVYYGARAMVVFREKGIAGCGEILRRALGKWRKRKSSH